MLGFERDGYLNTFNYQFYPGEKAHVTISGNQAETKLFVNGKLVETLNKQTIYHNEGGKEKMYYVRTLVLPLENIGVYLSKITNFKVTNYSKQLLLHTIYKKTLRKTAECFCIYKPTT